MTALKMMNYTLITIGIILTIAGIYYGYLGNNIKTSKSSKKIVFSQVEGIVTMDGLALEGAEITQSVLQDGDAIPSQVTRSDQQGEFEFEERLIKDSIMDTLPGQVSFVQKMIIRYNDKEYVAWQHTKSSLAANSELEGRPLKIICDLSTKPGFEGTHYGICREAGSDFTLIPVKNTEPITAELEKHLIVLGKKWEAVKYCTDDTIGNPDLVEAYKVRGREDLVVVLCPAVIDGMKNSISIFFKDGRSLQKTLEPEANTHRISNKILVDTVTKLIREK